MIASQRNTKICVVIMVVMTVISLAISAVAATAPSVSVLDPLDKGLYTPLRMALDQNGDVYVADPRSGGIVVLDQYGVVSKTISTPKTVNALAVLNPLVSNIAGGKILAAYSDQVVVLDQAGTEIAKLGSGAGQFKRAAGIAVDAAGKIFVTDSGAYSVKMFDSAGNYAGPFGVYGAPPSTGVFMQPTAISVVQAVGGQQVAVVDTVNGNVQFFTTEGVFVKSVGASGTAMSPLSFSYPVGLAFESDRMYVLDSYQGNVQVVDLSVDPPSFLSYIGSYGFAAGQLATPSDLLYDQVNRRLLVSNGMSNVVSFGIDGGSNPFNATPPALALSQSVISVDVPTVNISGTVDVGCTVAALVNTAAQASAASFPSSTSWSVYVTGLVPGLNTVSVTAKNQYGATVTKTVAVTYMPPTVQLTVGAYPALTNQAAMTLTGTTEPGSVVTVFNSATNIAGQASVIDNVWVYVASLVEGANPISVTSVKSGTASARQDISIALDSLSPVIVASLLNDGSTTANQVLGVSGTVTDQSPAVLTINGNPVALVNGQFNTAITLNYGPNNVTITAVDPLGNATSIVRTINFDPALQTIAIQSPMDGSFTNVQDLEVVVSAPDATSVEVNGVPALPGPVVGQWTAKVKLAAGLNTILVDALDVYNRTVQDKRTVFYDGVAPVVTIMTPSQDVATKVPGLTVKGLISDNAEIKSISATVNNVDVQISLVNNEYTLFAEFQQEGVYSIAVTVTDIANNKSTALRTIIYDVTAPVITIDPVLVAAPVKLEGTVEAGATVVVTDATGASAPVVMNGDRWSADLSGAVYEYASLSITATDAAGNSSAKSIAVPVPDGDVDGDNLVTIRDALKVIKLVVSGAQPSANDLLHGDVGPLLNGKRNPNGTLDLVDGILLLRKALGQTVWLQ
ncbi:MAG: hypothetical protein RW306_09865 [Geobacteraceae bacterium]|nr:hypothetical protein [Geobacteraceae bacterium]